jgi:hypothetical protein
MFDMVSNWHLGCHCYARILESANKSVGVEFPVGREKKSMRPKHAPPLLYAKGSFYDGDTI